ncbi:nucleotide-binding universal stress UspA family protein [Deinococcus budaensis]|uniref:Nucleotide-binding universal stress UspA family protein n=1 Tax=Deinococcus budaensis TaxID=1665626 RepID=A0A7W8GFS3_9DEIO|nr:universal stress protein [Deinococcus budaensis]MBB5234765.1 nucleotide-binding universal stress UspA family protein [Deinococcus budaensis]
MPLRILVPLETLEASQPALEAAREFFPDAALHLLHVVIPGEVPLRTAAFPAGPGEEAEAQVDRSLQARLEALGSGETLQVGDPAAEILERARSGAFDLIVLSPSGKRGLQRFLLGSVAQRVIRESPIPVMSVRRLRGGETR